MLFIREINYEIINLGHAILYYSHFLSLCNIFYSWQKRKRTVIFRYVIFFLCSFLCKIFSLYFVLYFILSKKENDCYFCFEACHCIFFMFFLCINILQRNFTVTGFYCSPWSSKTLWELCYSCSLVVQRQFIGGETFF